MLDLSNTSIDDAVLVHVAKFDKLRELNLQNTHVTDRGIHHLANLKRLSVLDVSGTEVTYEALAELEEALPGTNFQEQKALSMFSSVGPYPLTTGIILHTSATYWPAFNSKNSDEHGMSGFRVPQASFLHIVRPITLSTEHTHHLARLRSLTSAVLGDTIFPKEGLRFLLDLKALQDVSVGGGSNGNLRDEDLKFVAALPSLTRLSITSGSITDRGIGHLQKSPSLRHLDLGGQKLTPWVCSQLKDIKTLVDLDLSLWSKGDDGKYGQPAPQLTADAREGVARLATMQNLKKIHLWGNVFDDEAVEPLATSKSLINVRLDKRFVKQETADRLSKELPECKIELR